MLWQADIQFAEAETILRLGQPEAVMASHMIVCSPD